MANNDSIFNINIFFKFCFNNKFVLGVFIISSIIFSSIFSLYFMEEKFKSSAVIFPTATNSISQDLLAKKPNKKDILDFGEEESTEQLLQILNSDLIRDSIINIFNLYNHYKIDKEDPHSRSLIFLEYSNNITFKKTPYNSINIEVFDKDPNIASEIANKFLDLLDLAIKRIKSKRTEKALFICEQRKKSLNKSLQQVNDSLNIIRKQGVFYGTAQTERLIEQYAICLANNNKRGAQLIKKELNKLSKYITEHNLLERRTHHFQSEFNRIQDVCDLIYIDSEYDLTNKFVINKAFPADKKSYPIRWLVVLVFTFSIFIATIVILRSIELLKLNRNES